jgi:hypothetical protein
MSRRNRSSSSVHGTRPQQLGDGLLQRETLSMNQLDLGRQLTQFQRHDRFQAGGLGQVRLHQSLPQLGRVDPGVTRLQDGSQSLAGKPPVLVEGGCDHQQGPLPGLVRPRGQGQKLREPTVQCFPQMMGPADFFFLQGLAPPLQLFQLQQPLGQRLHPAKGVAVRAETDRQQEGIAPVVLGPGQAETVTKPVQCLGVDCPDGQKRGQATFSGTGTFSKGRKRASPHFSSIAANRGEALARERPALMRIIENW